MELPTEKERRGSTKKRHDAGDHRHIAARRRFWLAFVGCSCVAERWSRSRSRNLLRLSPLPRRPQPAR
uniref:Uncharacterized protein n=1 Tax=Setaria italica TaxID=4555 RepID=K3ZYT5_SETIT